MSRDSVDRILQQLEEQYQTRRQVLLAQTEQQCRESLKAASRSLASGDMGAGQCHLAEVENGLQSMKRFLYQVTDSFLRREYEMSIARLGNEAASVKETAAPGRRFAVA